MSGAFDGTVATFDAQYFRSSMRTQFAKATAVVVDQVTQQSGSVIVRYRLLFTSVDDATAAQQEIDGITDWPSVTWLDSVTIVAATPTLVRPSRTNLDEFTPP